MSFVLDPKDQVDGFSIITPLAGAPVQRGEVVYTTTSGRVAPADASAIGTMYATGIALKRAAIGESVKVLLYGILVDVSGTWTPGRSLYVSTVAGALTQTAPTPPDLVQEVGHAATSTMIYFNPFPTSGGGSTGLTKEEYYPPVESDAYIGQHYGAQMLDNVDTIVGFEFTIPNNFHTLVSAVVMVLQITAAAPDMVWSATTDFAEACSVENYDANQDATGSQTSQVLQNDLVCLDISAALTGITAGDLVGMEFLRDGDNGSDTVGGPVLCLGLRLRYR